MLTAMKIKLKPTKRTGSFVLKSAGVARWSYNYFIAESNKHYDEYLKGNRETKTIKESDVRKHINNVLKNTTHMAA